MCRILVIGGLVTTTVSEVVTTRKENRLDFKDSYLHHGCDDVSKCYVQEATAATRRNMTAFAANHPLSANGQEGQDAI
jgi:hypothetical protein